MMGPEGRMQFFTHFMNHMVAIETCIVDGHGNQGLGLFHPIHGTRNNRKISHVRHRCRAAVDGFFH